MAQPAIPLWSRKLDMLYLFFFVIHVPIMLMVDLYPLYPAGIRPQFMITLRSWYISTYKDRFFVQPTTYFLAYMWMEALYHIPLSLWAIGAIVRDDELVALNLLVWAVQTGVTTLTCVVEAMSWEDMSSDEKMALSQLYGPYLVLAAGMGLDMFLRVKSQVLRSSKAKSA